MVSGILLKTCWQGLSWEMGTIIQVVVCFVGFFAGALFGTSKSEWESREDLFREINSRAENAENIKVCLNEGAESDD